MDNNEKIDRIRKNHFFSLGDVVVYAVLVVLIFVFTMFAFAKKDSGGERFEILYQSKVIFTAELNKDAYYVFFIEDGSGKVKTGNDVEGLNDYNIIQVQDGKVSVVLSDCPDKVCYTGGVCLPHKLTVRVVNDGLESDV